MERKLAINKTRHKQTKPTSESQVIRSESAFVNTKSNFKYTMEEEEENMSPFWLQSRSRRRRRSSSSMILNSGVFLVVLLVVAVAFMLFVIPSFLSFTSQIFRPNTVKKSWDSLNLVLVLFAIVCGFLSRNSDNGDNSDSSNGNTATRSAYEDYKFENRSESFQRWSNSETPRRFWYDHQPGTTLNRLRSFSSYPDLRKEEALWASRDDQWRFYDDTHLYNPRSSDIDYLSTYQWRQPQQYKLEGEEEEKGKEKARDIVEVANNKDVEEESLKEVIYTPPPETATLPPPSETVTLPPPSPPPRPPEPPQAKVERRKVRRTYQDLERKEKSDHHTIVQRQEAPPPRPPPPPPPMFDEGGKSEKKRGGAGATKEFLTSLRRRKKKKQRQKSVENLDSFFNYESSYPLPSIPPPSPPPPPPPPPPLPFFPNLFSPKKRKSKKIHSDIPTPPPPPPPRIQKFSVSAAASKVESKNAPFASQNSPLPVKIKNYNNVVEENVNGGNESPTYSIPPPPPLPPFKMPALKFEVHGDFVRLKSNIGEDVEESSSPSDGGGGTAAMESGDGASTPLFCPSPDVNTKADNFIARFRAGLRLEKMNSVREKEGIGKSNLGPKPSPSPDE